MRLSVHIRKRLSSFDLDVRFDCEDKQLLALIGPSGAGKTTIVRIIAGLDRPDTGRISFGDEIWVDTARGIFVPPQKRSLGYVFQDYTLFPHLNLYRNVSFAAGNTGHVRDLMKALDIWELKDRKPHAVSGGERQRCAIAQALARGPKTLLLDEPFSALDITNRRKLRERLKFLKGELSIPIIHVTHDIDEALYLADEILPVVKGSIARKWILQFLMKEPVRKAKIHSAGMNTGAAAGMKNTERKVS